ncbi:MAG: PD-(D/E)XK nuclease family protein, partial [Silvanigrellaceae bacterium]|nr:PD-(D/E)XK nuclease family protein [Silvanigrellaceae bacterium]
IDYKTSNIPKTEKKLSLLPSELIEMKTSKLSVQGALYCLAWSQTKLLDEEDLFRNQIRSFSLYHLKNLDEKANPILNYEFGGDGLKKDNTHYQKLYNEYLVYANNLKSGNFYPKPIKKNKCEFCDFKAICSISKKQNDEDNIDNNTI